MADNLPINFAVPAETSFPVYDFYDTFTNTAYKNFYAVDLSGNYSFTPNALYGLYGYTYAADSVLKTFDLTLSNTLTLGGDAFVQIMGGTKFNSGGNNYGDLLLSCSLYHVDLASSETQIGNLASHFYSLHLDFLGSAWRTFLGKIVIPAGTTIKAGEKIRLKAQVVSNVGGWTAYLGHDPANRTSIVPDPFATTYNITATSTQTLMQLPIKIQL